ncbi:hypothetical protein ACTTAL_10460 [Rhodobacter capsulatus]
MPPAKADPVLDARLSEPVFGNALSLVMAGVIGHETGLQAALALRRLDAARRLGRRELSRFADLAGGGTRGAGDPASAGVQQLDGRAAGRRAGATPVG